MNSRLLKDMDFIIELDKIKSIERRTTLINSKEREDDAQHSWHISIMAMVLEEYSDKDLDISRVIKMLLVHDIVEIYAGDTFAYDEEGNKDKEDREIKSANKIFGMLSEDKSIEFRNLWDEFEEMKTDEALFATAMDRLQPVMLNYQNNGGTWVENEIKKSQVYKRLEPIREISEELWKYGSNIIEDAASKGRILE